MTQDKQPIFVLDTNILVDYPDVIPGEDGKKPVEPTVDLEKAHIIIPTAVIRELSKFKKETTERGKAARVVLRRLRDLFENNLHSIRSIYNLKAAIDTANSEQKISILPVHKNFHRSLAFEPAKDDMDGQVILTAMAASCIVKGYAVDGTYVGNEIDTTLFRDVVLLTNDNGLAIRARERGILTSRYGYKHPAPYTGRRDIVVPDEIFFEFWNARRVSREMFEDLMPPETPKLVANEFIIMKLAEAESYPPDYDANDPYFGYIGRYDLEEDAIVPLKFVSSFPIRPRNAGQAIYAEALANSQFAAVVCTGPAGSGKTYMATVFGYNACKNGQFIGVTIVPCEGRSNLGALPGDLDEKMDPDVQPIKNALRNYLISDDSKLRKEIENLRKFGTGKEAKKACSDCNGEENTPEKRSIKTKLKDRVDLIWDNWFSNIPIESARGRDFSYELAIYDEAQDQNVSQMDTLIKRLGADGKIVITGDIDQIHAPYLDRDNNGLVYAKATLLGSPLVAQVCFTEDEVIRHPLVKEVARRQHAPGNQLSPPMTA